MNTHLTFKTLWTVQDSSEISAQSVAIHKTDSYHKVYFIDSAGPLDMCGIQLKNIVFCIMCLLVLFFIFYFL